MPAGWFERLNDDELARIREDHSNLPVIYTGALENHPDLLKLYWAAQICGLYYTAISVQFQHAEVSHVLGNCDAQLLVTTRTQLEKVAGHPQHHVLLLED